MTVTAYVLSGGGSLGAVQVGMLQELAAGAVRPGPARGDVGGALNAAYVAGHGASEVALRGTSVTIVFREAGDVPLRVLAAPQQMKGTVVVE